MPSLSPGVALNKPLSEPVHALGQPESQPRSRTKVPALRVARLRGLSGRPRGEQGQSG